MKIGIIGAGNIGATLARLLAATDHEVMIANSRGPESLADLVAELGNGVQAGTVVEAAQFGEVVIEAVPFAAYPALPAADLADKLVISAANYYPERDGTIELDGRVDTELVASHLSTSRVIKAFNTIWFQHLASQGDPSLPLDQRRAIFVAGDDDDSKGTVIGLVEELGFGAIDTGSLHDGGLRQNTESKVYNSDITMGEARALLGS